jgi:hypothetical protein
MLREQNVSSIPENNHAAAAEATTQPSAAETPLKISSNPSLEPYIGKLERFELFSTNQCYYLVGCNKQNTAYRVLKMDRTLIEHPAEHNSNHFGGMSPHHHHQPSSRSTFDMGPSSHGGLGGGINAANNNPDSTAAQMADNSHTAKPTLRPLTDFLTEDPNVYSQEEIKDMLDMIHDGNRMTRSDGKPDLNGQSGGGLKPIVKAYGIVGFIRFLDCYYLTLITRRAKVGNIGDNGIYTIKVPVTIRQLCEWSRAF